MAFKRGIFVCFNGLHKKQNQDTPISYPLQAFQNVKFVSEKSLLGQVASPVLKKFSQDLGQRVLMMVSLKPLYFLCFILFANRFYQYPSYGNV